MSTDESLLFVPDGFELGTLAADRYRIKQFLGSGGSGFVVLAEDTQLEATPIVLKFLHSHLIEDERAFVRFRNETAIAFELNHPNIVQTFSFERWEGVGCFITMEYLPAGSLLETLGEHAGDNFDLKRFCKLLNMIIQGLGCAHQSGIVHRDIKPHNLLLEVDSTVKIADFGLSQLMWGETTMTHVGDMVGTPQYMSPEQLEGKAIDRRSDIYSLGITAFEIALGRPPFEGKSLYELAEQHFSTPMPSLRARGLEVPEWLDQFLSRCAAKRREDRFQSLEEAADFLTAHAPQDFEKCSFSESSPKMRAVATDSIAAKRMRRRLVRFVVASILLLTGLIFAVRARDHGSSQRAIALGFLVVEKYTDLRLPLLKSFFGIKVSRGDHHYFFENFSRDETWSLLASGVDPNFQREDGLTPLLWSTSEGVTFGEDRIEDLIYYGANPEVPDDRGKTPLHHCIERNWLECTEVLLAGGADPNKRDPKQRSPLHYAIMQRSTLMIELLLRHGANPNQPNIDGRTPLYFAVHIGNKQIIAQLLNGGGDPLQKAKLGDSSLDYAKVMSNRTAEHSEVYQLLLERTQAPNRQRQLNEAPERY